MAQLRQGNGAFCLVRWYGCELLDSGIGQVCHGGAMAPRGAPLGELTACLRCAVLGVEHHQCADWLTGAKQNGSGASDGPGVSRIAYPCGDRIQLAVQLGHQKLPGRQRGRRSDQQSSNGDQHRHSNDELAPECVAAEWFGTPQPVRRSRRGGNRRWSRLSPSAHRRQAGRAARSHAAAGRSTYPAPRSV
jgi:hypothetical protein